MQFSPVLRAKVFYNKDSVLPRVIEKKALYITDTNTTSLLKSATNYSSNIAHIELKAGERYKNLSNIEKILKSAIGFGLGRDCVFVAVGGGVILDMAGFAASIYMRGISLIFVPTTLLAMVDASIGGKTAIDFALFKNIVGTFYPAREVYICEQYLQTLPYKEYINGLAEIIKISLINRPSIYERVSKNLSSIMDRKCIFLMDMIKEAIEGKMEVVKSDPFENNTRAYLNLGHTFAHALESLLDFKGISHGQAVGWGISRALSLGVLLKVTDPCYAKQITSLLSKIGYSTCNIPTEVLKKLERKYADICDRGESLKEKIASLLIDKMKKDKKNKDGLIRCVLQEDLGKTFVLEVPAQKIKEVLL